jgi:beta-mannosidase
MLSQWRMKDFDLGAGLEARAFDDDARSEGWVDVTAPGDAYLALHAAGRLPHPFDDQNEAECAWVCQREWWWRCDFTPPALKAGERLVLNFLGIDTFATVWLNGEVLGEADNMFREYAFDVTERVLAGRPNKLAIKFDPPSDRLKDLTPPAFVNGAPTLPTKRNLVRKAQFGWGWDWGPVLPTVGLWRPVELTVRGPAVLDTVHFATQAVSADHARASVRVDVTAAVTGDRQYVAEITLTDQDGKVAATARATLSSGTATADFTLEAPQLWWTHDFGSPSLYTLDVRLLDGGDPIDRRTTKVGVRTIEIDQSPDPDEPGATFFRFVLNGRPIFSRGACWIPASSFVAIVGEADYRPLLRTMVEANMNMVRVWGGGVYEHDAFYDLCDSLGLLVWQDFMFACAPYPEDDATAESIGHEVRYQIERLCNHPSMAVWCGNNENQMIYDFTRRAGPELAALLGDLKPDEHSRLPGALYYDDVMPKAVAALDPTTPYWPGSPSGGPHANSMRAGDVHDWTVWHGLLPVPDDRPVGKFSRDPAALAYTRYAEDMARFVSEYGLHASPALETLRRAIPEADLYLHSPAMEHRIKDEPKDKVNNLLVSVTGLPTTLDEYVDFTQITQAEGLKFAIEHFRRRMPHCSGSLIWQYNDCWPCVSWSLMDYNGFGKAGYYYTRRAYAPVLASFKDLGDGQVELWITNEGLGAVDDVVTISLVDLVTGAATKAEVEVAVEVNASRAVWTLPATWPQPTAGHALHVRSRSGAFDDNRLFFAPIKDLQRPANAALELSVVQKGPHTLEATLTASAYTLFAHLLTPHGWTRFSDNYFDMLPGERRTIVISNPDIDLRPGDVTVRSF